VSVKEGTNVIFRYGRLQTAVPLYGGFLAVAAIAGLFLLQHNKHVEQRPMLFIAWAIVIAAVNAGNFFYLRSYRISLGERGLLVSSLFGSKEIFYMRLRRVELKPLGRDTKRCTLEVINDQGSPAIKVVGDKLDMEKMTSVLNTRVKPFGL
jgi:hypothetical protein